MDWSYVPFGSALKRRSLATQNSKYWRTEFYAAATIIRRFRILRRTKVLNMDLSVAVRSQSGAPLYAGAPDIGERLVTSFSVAAN